MHRFFSPTRRLHIRKQHMSARRRVRADDSDEDERPTRRSSNWFKDVQQQHRLSGKVLADVEVGRPSAQQRPSQQAPAAAASATAATPATVAAAPSGPKKVFSGLLAVAPVPFLASGAVNVIALNNYLAALKEDGVAAVYVNALWGGESYALTVQERIQVAEALSAGGAQLAIHVSSSSLAETVVLAKHAAQLRGVAAVVVSIPRNSYSRDLVGLEDALDFINEVAHAVPSTPLFVEHDDVIASFSLTELLQASSARGLVSNLRGAIARSNDLGDFSNAIATKAASITDVIYGGESNIAAAAFLGASSFAAREFSFIAPLYNKLIAAAQKGDAAATQKLQQQVAKFVSTVLAVVGNSEERRAAAAKVLTSLRSSTSFGAVRPPGARLTVHETSRLTDAFAEFVKSYTASTQAAKPPAPKPMKERDGYNGRLNGRILERIEFLESQIGIRNLASFFPHLRHPDGSWRKEYPTGANCNPARHIDHTILKAEATKKEITTLCNDAKTNNFFAVCVNGSRVAQCLDELRGTGVKVAAVIGFPLGAGTPKAKGREARELVELGAHEIDMVMNIGAMKDGNYKYVYEDVKAVVDAADPGIVKVIFETCLLTDTEIIDASILCVAAGAQFVKTSTGFNKNGATPEGLDIMLAVVGNEAETKAAGGVRDFATAAEYIGAGVSRIGTSSGVAIISGKPAGAGY
ncbi:deoxyribose-phosphate aldolase, putative [Bodo saltans]|uniref:deoxyribose-phosphate aldolase n=1 Tax=Bodo saltans TaxID=75058 RepID=A0A0S4JVL1_BODSA|nr:deoxyribose-phosphate aldolase, putative [Bodo saltans]|eukprot:CUG94285.1 deoxyribose-phosphate aldolase, putative [Bodo saltans]